MWLKNILANEKWGGNAKSLKIEEVDILLEEALNSEELIIFNVGSFIYCTCLLLHYG